MDTSDTHLLLLSQQDNGLAFRQLYDRHWKRLYLFSLKLLKDETEAKDVVQEVFFTLWSKRKELEINNIKAYLFATTKYKCLESLRRKRLDTTFLDKAHFFLGENNVEKEIHFKETQNILAKRIDLLPSKTRQIFKMSRYDELTNKEIAYKLNISTKTVEYHITQSIKQLRGSVLVSWIFFLKKIVFLFRVLFHFSLL